MTEARVAVVGLGHALLGDDALGLAVVRELDRKYAVPATLSVIDAGSSGLDLASYLLDLEQLIFVDALLAGEPPGTVRTFQHAELLAARPAGPRIAPHEPSIHDALALLSLAGRGPREALLVGVVPESMDVGVELSPAALRALPHALDEVVGHLRRFGIELSLRNAEEPAGLVVELEGVVQGVGMRPWLRRTAERLGLRGRVWNSARGVTIEAFGPTLAREALLEALHGEVPAPARVDARRVGALVGPGPSDFSIADSEAAAVPVPSIPPDLALCELCLREIDDPLDRRFGYPFTHCTACGPRFSIATRLPYDRANTTMAGFAPCAACAREYDDPSDRRSHAQAIACPSCGPRLWLEAPLAARAAPGDLLAELVRRLNAGETLAIQGLGGFHLAADATNADAVQRLRERKQREAKPFAVMVASKEMAESLAELDGAARRALVSPEHPIVIARARPSKIASNVAPGSTRIGLFLPYTPFHQLLLERFGRPLLLTSDNLNGEPIAVTRADAERTLATVADAFVFHDRPIVRRVEDSVVVSAAGQIQVLRRARGYAPRGIRLQVAASEPILAVGGHLKNTACLVVGDRAYLTSHLGDLESYEAERAFRDDIEGFQRLLGVCPRVVAHDLHPDYASTRYAFERPGASLFGVQHHLAHVLAAVAEQRIEGPVVAAAFDGSGFGTDGTAWGAEILQVDGTSYTRPFSVRALRLAGGERGIRQVWRLSWALLLDAFGAEAHSIAAGLALFENVPAEARAGVTRMLEAGANVSRVRGMGRYFDAFGALCLGRAQASFEGQLPMAFEEAAHGGSFEPYAFGMPIAASPGPELSQENELDLRPTVRAVVGDLLDGVSRATIAARFHATIVEATARLLELAGAAKNPVILTGGCFQNQLLYGGLRKRLASSRLAPPGEVPINDGGIALGQAFAAALALQRGDL